MYILSLIEYKNNLIKNIFFYDSIFFGLDKYYYTMNLRKKQEKYDNNKKYKLKNK